MKSTKPYFNVKFLQEYFGLTKAFLETFRDCFDANTEVVDMIPNYICFLPTAPDNINGVRCYRYDEEISMFVVYPVLCYKELIKSTYESLPASIRSAEMEFNPYDISRWALAGLMTLAVGLSGLRRHDEWIKMTQSDCNTVWNAISETKPEFIENLTKIIRKCILRRKPISLCLMDFDFEFELPIFD